jgi:hypothetical protein
VLLVVGMVPAVLDVTVPGNGSPLTLAGKKDTAPEKVLPQ